MEKYDEFYFIQLAEEAKIGKKVVNWLNSLTLSQDDIIDLDERIMKKFKIPEEKAGKIVELFVRYKAGAFSKNELSNKINKL